MKTSDANEDKSITQSTPISIGLLIGFIGLLAPMVWGVVTFRAELVSIKSDIKSIRNNMGDRWSASMMTLWAERMKQANGNLTIPNVHDVKKDMPLPDPMP